MSTHPIRIYQDEYIFYIKIILYQLIDVTLFCDGQNVEIYFPNYQLLLLCLDLIYFKIFYFIIFIIIIIFRTYITKQIKKSSIIIWCEFGFKNIKKYATISGIF